MSVILRARIHLNGLVQGVGFRPFVYRTARRLGLKGFVVNDTTGVVIEVEGSGDDIEGFFHALRNDKPPLAEIFSEEVTYEAPCGYDEFQIRTSHTSGRNDVALLPDIATCRECTAELNSPSDRRYRYPFINCTNCGPRFTIIERLPYDRPNTTMKDFRMCPDCEAEYHDPADRRFHAQPNACPVCGPKVWLLKGDSTTVAEGDEALAGVVSLIGSGGIVAVKGIGGFHLLCDATNDEAVETLRRRKRRSEKPFAVMFKDLRQLLRYAEASGAERALLLSPSRPVVLLKRRPGLLEAVSQGLKSVGAFLPYSPLHTVILEGLDVPVVATSGNLSEEPIVKDNDEALERLAPLVDHILLHDRPIHRRCDDPVVKVVGGKAQMIRRSRGYVPVPLLLPFRLERRVLAVGGHLKNTFAIGFEDRVILSQHIGDMDAPESMDFFEEAIEDLSSIYRFTPDVIAHDLHPGYSTTRWALGREGAEKVAVQHHHAHILSCMAENGLTDRVLGVSWDGTGYGEDGTLWGGEFLLCDGRGYRRLFHLRPLRLIGGEKAVREPRRTALSILFELFGREALEMDLPALRGFKEGELVLLWNAWQKGINSPLSSSAGRLFDALASLMDVVQVCTYEAQAAMMVEDLFDPAVKDRYTYSIRDGVIDLLPAFHEVLRERERTRAATRFMNTLARIIIEVAGLVGEERVCLSGGVFQNSPLSSLVIEGLRKEGFEVFTHRVVPANDGGISLGQAVFGGMSS